MKTEDYRKFQVIASICIAVFIASFGICLLSFNRGVYKRSAEDYYEGNTIAITKAEATLYYEQIADSFCSFFKSGYDVGGYTLTDTNIRRLNRLKGYYRMAWIISIFAFVGMVYSFRKLWRRRETMPCFYGSAGGALLVAVMMLRLVFSHKTVLRGLRDMILKNDYSYFSQGDLLCQILPDGFARNLVLWYLLIVVVEIAFFVLIRVGIRFLDRPHRY